MSSASDLTTTSRNSKKPAWWPWHQRLGIGFSAVIVMIVLTGIALNHTGGLRLDDRRITTPWILDWYGMQPAGEPIAYQAEGWALQWDERITWNGDLVTSAQEPLVGAVALGSTRVLASSSELFLLAADGNLIEHMDSASLPPGEILEIGKLQDDVYLITSEGRFRSEDEISAWDRYQLAGDFQLSVAVPAPVEQREAALQAFRGEGITLYRVLLDLHSGRLFGTMGVWIVDAAALAMLFLTMTGVWYALRVKRR
ncbi:MAG: hypothetical protein HOH58_13755 [Opitutaceae bacterium]|jgi:uncharacterized iron-regulated membrane protein|nr:hypothetical protein [Opitutaceae bacterium]